MLKYEQIIDILESHAYNARNNVICCWAMLLAVAFSSATSATYADKQVSSRPHDSITTDATIATARPIVRATGSIFLADFTGGNILQYDTLGNLLASFIPSGSTGGADIGAMGPLGITVDDSNNIYYSVANDTGNDGLIHVILAGQTTDSYTIPTPKGKTLGGLDFKGKYLWGVSFNTAGDGNNTVYKLNPTTGAIKASCTIPDGDPFQTTIAVGRTTFWSDSLHWDSDTVTEYQLPTSKNAGNCIPTGKSYLIGMGPSAGNIGIDFAGKELISIDYIDVNNYGAEPFNGGAGPKRSFAVDGVSEDFSWSTLTTPFT